MKYRSRRKPTDYEALLCAESGDFPVTVQNVSAQGVNVIGLGGIVFPDSDVLLIVQHQRFPGRISWVHEDVAGVKLKAPLPPKIATLLSRGTGHRGVRRPHRW